MHSHGRPIKMSNWIRLAYHTTYVWLLYMQFSTILYWKWSNVFLWVLATWIHLLKRPWIKCIAIGKTIAINNSFSHLDHFFLILISTSFSTSRIVFVTLNSMYCACVKYIELDNHEGLHDLGYDIEYDINIEAFITDKLQAFAFV